MRRESDLNGPQPGGDITQSWRKLLQTYLGEVPCTSHSQPIEAMSHMCSCARIPHIHIAQDVLEDAPISKQTAYPLDAFSHQTDSSDVF